MAANAGRPSHLFSVALGPARLHSALGVKMHMQLWKGIVAVSAGIACALLAVFTALWALFCALGGPDGNIGSRESIIWTTVAVCFFALQGAMAGGFFWAAAKREDRSKSPVRNCFLYAAPIAFILATALLVLALFPR